MRRLFWLGLGAASGILAMRRLTSAAQAYTPSGLAGNIGSGLASLGDGLREMAAVVREGMDQREAELRVALGIDTGIGPGEGDSPRDAAMTPEQAQALIEDPTGPRPAADRPSLPSHRAR